MQHCRILACKSFQNKYITALMLQQWNDSQNPSPTPIHDESWRWCSESCHWKSPRETAHSWQVAVNGDEVNCIACLRKSLSAPILATSWLETLPQTPSDKSKGHDKTSSLRQALLRITCKKKWSYMELEISCIDSLIDRWLVTFMDRWLMTACGTNSEIQAGPVMFAPGKNFQHKLHDKILNLARWPEWQERKLKDRSLKSIKLQTG